MIIKRTFQNHNGLIFNDLRAFIGGGGGKTDKILCGSNAIFLKKNKIKKEKRKKKILKNDFKAVLRRCFYVGG